MAPTSSLLASLVLLPSYVAHAADYPVNIPFEDWDSDNEELQEYWEYLATATGGAGVLAATILAIIFIIMIFLFWCSCCHCAVVWQCMGAPGQCQRVTAAVSISLCIVVIATMCGIVHMRADEAMDDVQLVMNRTVEDLFDEGAKWACGGAIVDEIFFKGNSLDYVRDNYALEEYCDSNSVAGFVQEVDGLVNDTLNSVVDFCFNLSAIEPPVATTKEHLLDAYDAIMVLGSGGGVVASVTESLAALKDTIQAMNDVSSSPIVDINGGPYHINRAIPDASIIPDVDESYNEDILEGESQIKTSLDEVLEIHTTIVDTLADVQTSTVDQVRQSYQDVHETATDIIDDVAEFIEDLADNRRDVNDAKADIGDDVKPIVVSVAAGLLGVFIMFGLCSAIGSFNYEGSGRIVGMIGGCCTYIWIFWLTVVVGIFAVAHLFVDDTCSHLLEGLTEGTPGIIQVNVGDRTSTVGNTTVEMGPLVQEILQCPMGCNTTNSAGCNTTNNLVSIMGLDSEFDFQPDVADAMADLDEAQAQLNQTEAIQGAQDAVTSEWVQKALELDFSQSWDYSNYTGQLAYMKQVLPQNATDTDKWVAFYETATPSGQQIQANDDFKELIDNALALTEVVNAGIQSISQTQAALQSAVAGISLELSAIEEITATVTEALAEVVTLVNTLVAFILAQSYGVMRCGWIGNAWTIVSETFCEDTMDSIYDTIVAVALGVAAIYISLAVTILAVRYDPTPEGMLPHTGQPTDAPKVQL